MTMNRLLEPDIPSSTASFKRPFADWSPERRLLHFRNRQNVRFFAVPDKDAVRRDRIDAVLQDRFELNNETHRLPPCFDWHRNPSDDIEWQIMLHKFYYAVGLGMAYQESGDDAYLTKWIELTERWIDEVQPNFLDGVSPLNDPLFVAVEGRRIQNWIFAYYFFVATNKHDLPPAFFHEKLLASIEAQVEFLVDHLAPKRNHRTLELWAIFLAAVVFPEFAASDRWRVFALAGLQQNIEDDLLADGVQCELSTHYHHIVLRNYLGFRRLAALNDILVLPLIDEALREALNFAAHVHKPDGTIPALSDADVGAYLDLIGIGADLYNCPELAFVASQGKAGRQPAETLSVFKDSGYVVMRSGWGDRGDAYRDERYMVFDCGPLGAGNHGHLDLLSIELAAYGRSLIVDPGRYTYKESGKINWRAAFRGTAAHNTVVVDGKDQARYELAGKRFKITGPHPEHELRRCHRHERLGVVHGIARSYEYDAVHERIVMFVDGTYWTIVDRLTSSSRHHYDLRFQLDGSAFESTVIEACSDLHLVSSPNLQMAHLGAERATVAHGFVAKSYGDKQAAPRIRFEQTGENAIFTTILFPHGDDVDPPKLDLQPLVTRDRDGASVAKAHAISIKIHHQGKSWQDILCLAPDETNALLSTKEISWRAPYGAIRRHDDGRITTLGHAVTPAEERH